MATLSYSDITAISSGAGSIPCNQVTPDSLVIDSVASTGLGGRQKRATIHNRAQTHGFLLHEIFREGMHIVIVGRVHIRSVGSPESAIVTARDAFISNVQAVLDGMDATTGATGTITFGSGGSLAVKNDTGYDFPRVQGLTVNAQFGLVTAI
jgi:hypothetical protein